MESKAKEISEMKIKICERLEEINQSIKKKLDNKSNKKDYKLLEDD